MFADYFFGGFFHSKGFWSEQKQEFIINVSLNLTKRHYDMLTTDTDRRKNQHFNSSNRARRFTTRVKFGKLIAAKDQMQEANIKRAVDNFSKGF